VVLASHSITDNAAEAGSAKSMRAAGTPNQGSFVKVFAAFTALKFCRRSVFDQLLYIKGLYRSLNYLHCSFYN
jgi:hypothetical protein